MSGKLRKNLFFPFPDCIFKRNIFKYQYVRQNNVLVTFWKNICPLLYSHADVVSRCVEKLIPTGNFYWARTPWENAANGGQPLSTTWRDATATSSEVEKLTSKHSSEVTTLNGIIRKAKRWFPMLEARLQMENLCQKIGFTAEQTGVLLTGKSLEFSGLLYSEEHKRKFNVENAEIKVFSDSTKPNQLFLYINRQPIVEWFKEQWDNLWRVTKCRLKL